MPVELSWEEGVGGWAGASCLEFELAELFLLCPQKVQ